VTHSLTPHTVAAVSVAAPTRTNEDANKTNAKETNANETGENANETNANETNENANETNEKDAEGEHYSHAQHSQAHTHGTRHSALKQHRSLKGNALTHSQHVYEDWIREHSAPLSAPHERLHTHHTHKHPL
jgi:hypothetical protein